MTASATERQSPAFRLLPAQERFDAQTQKGPDCWLWTGSVQSAGYGQLGVNGRSVRAHRFAYEQVNGPIPHGLVIDHLCHTRLCVNPDHMEVVTRGENVRRGWSKNRALRTHCAKGHELLDSWPISHGWRTCLTCPRTPQSQRARIPSVGRKVSAEQVRAIRALASDGWTKQAIADQYGIHRSSVSRIVREITCQDVGP